MNEISQPESQSHLNIQSTIDKLQRVLTEMEAAAKSGKIPDSDSHAHLANPTIGDPVIGKVGNWMNPWATLKTRIELVLPQAERSPEKTVAKGQELLVKQASPETQQILKDFLDRYQKAMLLFLEKKGYITEGQTWNDLVQMNAAKGDQAQTAISGADHLFQFFNTVLSKNE